jgi:Flp pilus assembly protein TadD
MAIALDPRYPTAHQWYGELLYHTGQVDSAIVEIGRAKELDPLAPIITGAMGFGLYLAGRYEDCISELKKGLELAPSMGLLHMQLGACYARSGDFAHATQSSELAVHLDHGLAVRQGQLAYVYGLGGEKSKAAAVTEKLNQRARSQSAQWFPVSMAEVGMGDKDAALTALERAVDGHEIGISEFSLLNDRIWDSLRSDPRFQRILERTNLARYQQPGH